ncbi:MAG TPA: molybdopterin-dependent oxidoreductase [Bryobacteraceae bacterium]|nr:molybdopterin-dependent oxidoreductase [Bryobacteraceae bacterium]
MRRRELLQLTGAALLGVPLLSAEAPQNLSSPLQTIAGTSTTPDLLFVRDHFKEPDVSLEKWSLRIEGAVQKPYQLGFADLVELPSLKLEAVLECAGNVANGSAVSSGLWEGVGLAALLEAAHPDADAVAVLLEGADSGRLFDDCPALPYSQIVPLTKCNDAESLVAYKYNELALPKRNGFPARALFPGWYGMNSVKWLSRIRLLRESDRETTFHQSGMNRLYNRVTQNDGAEQITRLSGIQLKSVLAWPTNQLKLPAGRHLVWGFAWSGANAIRKVNVSSDRGETWSEAKLDSAANGRGWVRWSYPWLATPGDHILMSRASDSNGNQQPLQRDPTRKDAYELNWCSPVHCSVL